MNVYSDIIQSAEKASARFEEVAELLEYPEVQADRAYYLSVLSDYNKLRYLRDKKLALSDALAEENALYSLLKEEIGEDRGAVYAEITKIKSLEAKLARELADALGCKHIEERAYFKMSFSADAAEIAKTLFSLITEDLKARGARVDAGRGKDNLSFTACGEDVLTRLIPLTGVHRVYFSDRRSGEICVAATEAARTEIVDESDIKIDLFHSSGAGGQNINKVETAVRATHKPTGISVVCRNERSQLSNRKEAISILKSRVKERGERLEKDRMEADIRVQLCKKNSPITFNASKGTLTDVRSGLKTFDFPPSPEAFSLYVDGLITV